MYYNYTLKPFNSRKLMYNVFQNGTKRCLITLENLRNILEKESDIASLNAGTLVKVRLLERKLVVAAKQLF